MDERIELFKQKVLAPFRQARVFYSGHRMLLLSGLTILSILLIVWARMGFTLQVNRFFAGSYCTGVGGTCRLYSCSGGEIQSADTRANDDCAADAVGAAVGICCVPSAASTPSPTPVGTPASTGVSSSAPTLTPTATVSASQAPTPSPSMTSATPPSSVSAYTITVSGRNVTTAGLQAATVQLQSGQQAEVIVTVRNTQYSVSGETTPLSNVVVRAVVPTGLAYISGSTSVAGTPTSIDSIATGGLALGVIAPQQELSVAFRVRAVTSQFAAGATQTAIAVGTTVAGASQQTATLPVTVTRVIATVPGTVKTGPGDAVLVALLMSAIMTLLYVSYSHTAAYRRKEIEAITHDRDPLDFRS